MDLLKEHNHPNISPVLAPLFVLGWWIPSLLPPLLLRTEVMRLPPSSLKSC